MLSVLIVDDEPLVRASIRALCPWEYQGFDLSGDAQNGLTALDELERRHYDIVLLDMAMPRCDGIGFLRKLQDLQQNPVVVAVSAFDEFSLVREAFTLGAYDYLLKADLSVESVRSVLERAAAHLQVANHPRQRSDEGLRMQILKDFLTSSSPSRFLNLLGDVDLRLEFPILLCEFRAPLSEGRRSNTLFQFLKNALQSRTKSIVVNLSPQRWIWIVPAEIRGADAFVESASHVCREQVEIAKQTLNVALDWAVGEPIRCCEDLPIAMTRLDQLFSNASRPVSKARSYIREHYRDSSLSLADVADHAGVSRTHLSSLFAKELGMGFSDFLIQVRMNEAKRLLEDSCLKVYQIAEEVGYGSAEQFSRTFKKLCGVTANRYQKDRQGDRS